MLFPLIAIIGIVFAAASLQGFAGFGFSLLFMGCSSLITSTTHASIVGSLLGLMNASIVLWNVRRSIDLGKIRAFFVGGAFGLPLGVWGLASLESRWLALGLGIVLVLFCSYSLINPPKSRKPWPTFWGYPMGVSSGILGGALNTAGPPLVIYSYYQPWDKDSIKASLLTFFVVMSLYKVLLLFATRLMTQQILFEAAAALPVQLLGATAGIRMSHRCSKEQIRRIAFLILIGLGVLLLIQGK